VKLRRSFARWMSHGASQSNELADFADASAKLSLANLCRLSAFIMPATSVYAVEGFFP
jgi:1-aminocyclopropane-1-carboxylate deaminase/D-cysteine desulfhydrase-like pyridoxal-dependent ACC family enzyme